jgi:hypothetical protein
MRSKFQYHGEVEVYGILLESRHGRLKELREMLNFAEHLYAQGMARYVRSVFYDSNGAIAQVRFHIPPVVCDPIFSAVEAVALRTLRCFELEAEDESGGTQHGRGFDQRPGAPLPPRWHEWAR